MAERTAEGTAAPVADAGGGLVATFRVPHFAAFFFASLFYFTVWGTQTFAFAWLVLELSESAALSAVAVFALGVPAIFVTLPAGVLYDRVDRRGLLVVTTLGGAAVLAVMAVVIGAGAITVALTFLFALGIGVAFGVNQPAMQAVVPSLVPPERLLSAVSLQTMGMTVGMALGAALGGVVISEFGIAEAFWLQAGLLLAAALLLLRVRVPPPPPEAAARPLDMRGEIGDGVRFVFEHRGLRGLVILMAVLSLLMLGPTFALIPDLARTKLGQDADTAGLLFAITSIGMFAISLILAALGELRRMGLILLLSMVSGGVFVIAMGLSEVYLVTAIIMLLWGAGGGFVVNTNRTLIQSRTPPEMMGRVMAFYGLAFGAARPLGSLLVAPLAAWIGSDGALVVAGVLLLIATLWMLATERELREME